MRRIQRPVRENTVFFDQPCSKQATDVTSRLILFRMNDSLSFHVWMIYVIAKRWMSRSHIQIDVMTSPCSRSHLPCRPKGSHVTHKLAGSRPLTSHHYAPCRTRLQDYVSLMTGPHLVAAAPCVYSSVNKQMVAARLTIGPAAVIDYYLHPSCMSPTPRHRFTRRLANDALKAIWHLQHRQHVRCPNNASSLQPTDRWNLDMK